MSPALIEKNYLKPNYSTISEEKEYKPKHHNRDAMTIEEY